MVYICVLTSNVHDVRIHIHIHVTTYTPTNTRKHIHMNVYIYTRRYLKTICTWTFELGLCGCVILCGRVIMIVLGGDRQDILQYLRLHRTTNVDVDSNGRRYVCVDRSFVCMCLEALYVCV